MRPFVSDGQSNATTDAFLEQRVLERGDRRID
jgi:hypothetical protein